MCGVMCEAGVKCVCVCLNYAISMLCVYVISLCLNIDQCHFFLIIFRMLLHCIW